MANRVVIVPGHEIRSTTVNDKGQAFATIHTGKFRVISLVDEDGKVRVPQSVFDDLFEVVPDAT